MRTTVRLDDDLIRELRRRATAEKRSLTQTINGLLRVALKTSQTPRASRTFRQKTLHMGAPAFDLDKALQMAADLETEEILRKLAARK